VWSRRVWVLLDAGYNVWLYRQGVLRMAAVPYTRDVTNHFAHLTNHCIAQSAMARPVFAGAGLPCWLPGPVVSNRLPGTG
jgi:hypothetical protein